MSLISKNTSIVKFSFINCGLTQNILNYNNQTPEDSKKAPLANTKYYQNYEIYEKLTQEEITKFAKLNSSQINDLKKLKSYDPFSEMIEARNVVIILPTYIPLGFNISHFTVGNGWEFYRILYKNNENLCFGITAYTQEGGASSKYNTVTAISPHIGEILIGYTEFSRINNSSQIVSIFGLITDNNDVYSSVYIIGSPETIYENKNCKSIPIEEFKKIVESLRFLDNQYLNKNLEFYNDILSIDPEI